MKKNEIRFIVYLLEMIAFGGILLFGIFCGHEHPQMFFWGIMAMFAISVASYISPSLKDTVILIVGMIILATAATLIDKIVCHFFGNSFLAFIVQMALLAPFYIPLARHYLNMCKKAIIRWKQEDKVN